MAEEGGVRPGEAHNGFAGHKESAEAFQAAQGKIIRELRLDPEEDGAVEFYFGDGSGIVFYDDARSCCEERHLRTDDDLSYHIGAELLDAEVKEGPDEGEAGDVHETAFLHVTTSKGVFVVAAHNIHNGYYGGINIRAQALDGSQRST